MYAETQPVFCLIPAYNESDHISSVVRSASQFLPILVVDDGSADTTASQAEEAGAWVVRHPTNQGKGAALMTGFRAALERGCAAVITLDADGQHDPREIPKFIAEFERQPVGLIIGQRDFSKMPLRRRLPNTFGKWFFSWAVGQEIRDNQSGYRLISADLLTAMLSNPEHGFEFEVAMIVECLRHRLGLGWVPIRTIYAGEKSHIHPLRHLQNFIRVSLAARKMMKTPAGQNNLT